MKTLCNITTKDLEEILIRVYKRGNEESNVNAKDVVNELKTTILTLSTFDKEKTKIRN